ncbi:MAG: DNA methyltransferase, partial [Myxococcota bacterium]
MTPHDFIAKWRDTKLKERAAAQEHFLDLCHLLDEPTPADSDRTGKDYGFEVGATKTTGGQGFADVFKRHHFAWEYKGTRANLDAAFAQLQRYAVALDNPPLLIVSDIGTTIRIHTNWTNSISRTYEIAIDDLTSADTRAMLKAVFADPESLRPTKTRQELTEEVAAEFAKLTGSLRARGHGAEEVAHFVNRLVFCMFAEDVDLLPAKMFTRMLERALEDPSEFEAFAKDLFAAMQSGGRVGFEKVSWFNGGLFDSAHAFALTRDEIKAVHKAAIQHWGDIDPAILGTLFERGLDPAKRSQLGAHYTDRAKIEQIIGPAIAAPLSAEWETAKAEIEAELAKSGKTKSARTRAANRAQAMLDAFLDRLKAFRVLDPACGSGNFLYVALKTLKDIEHRAHVEAEAMGLPRRFPEIGPEAVRGIELSPYAAELARVSVWIGEIQWMLKNGFAASTEPILKPLDTIENRDALLTQTDDGAWVEAEWPAANAIVGNPPFIGDKLMVGELGEDYTANLRATYAGKVAGGADLVLYWVSKGLDAIDAGRAERAGFVTTNSVRGGANRRVLDRIADGPGFVAAYSDEPWTVEGAALRVSLLVYGARAEGEALTLNGVPVARINADLTGAETDLTRVCPLDENAHTAFVGDQKSGAFDVSGDEARRLLRLPSNPNGRPNSDVVRPWLNGMDVTRRPSGRWIIDFGTEMGEADASLYEAPFEKVNAEVKPKRANLRRDNHRIYWWRHGEARPGMRRALAPLERFIGTPRVAKHRLFVWVNRRTLPDSRIVAIARDDDTTFGILHCRFHEAWSLRTGGWHGVGNDPQYNAVSCFETFPFPDGFTPAHDAADYADDPRAKDIAEAAATLDRQRSAWLNPPELV